MITIIVRYIDYRFLQNICVYACILQYKKAPKTFQM